VILYLDASAFVKRYLRESGSDFLRRVTDATDRWFTSRIGYVETVGAIARKGSAADLAAFQSDWESVNVVELHEVTAQLAGMVAVEDRLDALDAIHLALALPLVDEELVFATWDRRLHAAARKRGLTLLPEKLA